MSFFILSCKKPDYFLIKYEFTQCVNGQEHTLTSGYCTKSINKTEMELSTKDKAKPFESLEEAKKYILHNAIFKCKTGNKTWEEPTLYSLICNWNEMDSFDYESFEIEEIFLNDSYN